jgi:hypothetical protein
MAFSATSIIFNDTPSEFFNIYLGNLGDSGEDIRPAGGDVSLLTQKIFRKPSPLFFGAEQQPVLSFPLNFYSPDEIDAITFSKISGWLFGQQEYHRLYLCQNDMTDIYFNAFFTQPNIIRIGNIVRGFTTTAVCDSPFGWKSSGWIEYDNIVKPQTIEYFNPSDDAFYTYPVGDYGLWITFDALGGSGTITNVSDNNRILLLENIFPNDDIWMEPALQKIESYGYNDPNILEKFNFNWLRFVRGHNTLIVDGNINYIGFEFPIAVKIG